MTFNMHSAPPPSYARQSNVNPGRLVEQGWVARMDDFPTRFSTASIELAAKDRRALRHQYDGIWTQRQRLGGFPVASLGGPWRPSQYG